MKSLLSILDSPRAATRFLALLLLVAMVGNAWLGFRLSRSVREDSKLVDESHLTIEAAEKVFADVIDAETGQRGFLLTQDPSYLAPYLKAAESVEASYRTLRTLTEGDSQQLRRVDSIKPWIDQKLAELKQTIDLQNSGQRQEALDLVAENTGRDFMVEIRSITDAIVDREQQLLTTRSKTRDRTYAQTQWSWTLTASAILMVFVLFVDSSRRHAKTLQEARDKADAANRARGEFLANMSHEIRTPMTAIIGHTDILEEELKDPDNVECVRTIRTNGQHLLAIINDILDLSKIDAGKFEFRTEPVELGQFVGQIHTMLAPLASSAGLKLHLRYATKVPAVVVTDPIRLRQVLVNLTGNAIKFTDEGSVSLTVNYLAEQQTLMFTVEDTGIGMEADVLERLFEPFEQAETGSNRRFEGTGLGLTIARKFVEALGGRIDASSVVGKGSVFCVFVPVTIHGDKELISVEVGHHEAEDQGRSTDPSRLNCRVLVVDDRREIRFLSRRLIEKAGGRVVEATNGQEAIDLLTAEATPAESIDVCLMDMQMPVMDGAEAVRRLREGGVTVPIIALTANAMKSDEENCLRIGFDDYCSKPINADVLTEKIQMVLKRESGHRSG